MDLGDGGVEQVEGLNECGEVEEKVDREEHIFETFNAQEQSIEQSVFGSLKDWVRMEIGSCREWLLDAYCDVNTEKKTFIGKGINVCDLCESKIQMKGRLGKLRKNEAKVESFRITNTQTADLEDYNKV